VYGLKVNSCVFISPKFPDTVGSVTTWGRGMEEEGGYEMWTPVVQELGSSHKVLDSSE